MKPQSRRSALRAAAIVAMLCVPVSAMAFHDSPLDQRIKQPLAQQMADAERGCREGNQQMCALVSQIQQNGNLLAQAQQNCQAGNQMSCQMIEAALQQMSSGVAGGSSTVDPNAHGSNAGSDFGLTQQPPDFGSQSPEPRTGGGPPPLTPQREYYVAENGQQVGPLGLQQLREKIAAGTLGPTTLVWTDGMADWQPASRVADVAALF